MNIFAEIKGLRYTPLSCKKLSVFKSGEIDTALSKKSTFILEVQGGNQIAVSWWVSPKRTRSYPYTRVYDSLSFSGKKVTLIPVMKDEGKEGDRDFLQWDTVSLMSLLGVYVIISYYSNASISSRYEHKITNQRFKLDHLKSQIEKLLYYQSDALHWNLSQIDKIGEIGRMALESYDCISNELGVEMHSSSSAEKRIEQLLKGKESFMALSRDLARGAQDRESVTSQPKEHLKGIKATLTIQNYLGGKYYFTCDESEIHRQDVFLIEAKHTKTNRLPSIGDIKDGLLKMMIFTNLENVRINDINYNPIPILKLTTGDEFDINSVSVSQENALRNLEKEAKANGFRILINDQFLT